MPYKDVETRRKAQSKWIRKNTQGFYIRLNKKTDSDIISYLETLENKQGYVKELIRKDIERELGKSMIKSFNDGWKGIQKKEGGKS